MKDYDWEMGKEEKQVGTLVVIVGFIVIIVGQGNKLAWVFYLGWAIVAVVFLFFLVKYLIAKKKYFDMRKQEKQNAADKDENYTGNVKLNFKNLRY